MTVIEDGNPIPGYYKMRAHKGRAFLPVAIWEKDGELVARVGSEMRDPNEIWLWCAKNRVSKTDAKIAFETGRWPDEAPPPIGHNNPDADPFEALHMQIEAEAMRVKAWVAENHAGKQAIDLAANWVTELRKLENKAKQAAEDQSSGYRAEHAAVFDRMSEIETKWGQSKATAASIKKLMHDLFQDLGRQERNRLQAIADQQAREQAAAERKKREEDAARQAELARMHGIAVDLAPVEPEIPPAEIKAPPVKVAYGGAQGNRIGVRKIPPQALVEDWAKAAVHYASYAKVREVIQKLANHDARDGRVDLPGVKIIPGEQ